MSIDNKSDRFKKPLRVKADQIKPFRCTTLTCVLENPANIGNIGSVLRNIDCLGVGKLYIIGKEPTGKKDEMFLKNTSSGANKRIYVHYFNTTEECIGHLKKGNYISLVTSPHIKGKTNLQLETSNFTKFKKLAIWFGNESKGISETAIKNSRACIQIGMYGFTESFNLAISTGIVLHTVANQRRQYKLVKKE